MKRLVASLIVSSMLLLSACSALDKGTVYEYDEPELVSGLVLTRAVYKDDTLTLYHDGTIDDDCRLYSEYYAFEYEIDDDCIVITYDDIDEVTSFSIERSQHYRYNLRYLNSDQYAVLAYEYATEVGWSLRDGDPDSYYTEVELEVQARNQAERQAAFDASWAIVEGYYEAQDGRYIEFFIDDNGIPQLCENNHNKRVFSFGSNGSSWVANCSDDPYDYTFYFELAADASYMIVTDYSNGEDVTYYRR